MTWQNISFRAGWPIAALAVLVLMSVLYTVILYRRETQVSWHLRWLMAACRIAALGLLLTLLFKPVLKVPMTTPVRRTLLVLADDSASMAIRDTRKDSDQLAEAAIALGKIPGDNRQLQRVVDAVVQSMRQATTALADDRPDDAVRAQGAVARSLTALRAALPTTAGEPLTQLNAIAQRQEQLKNNPATTNGPAAHLEAASRQSEIADDLTGWYRVQRNAGRTMSDKLKSEMTTVMRSALVQGALTQPQNNVFRDLSAKLNVRYFRFGQQLEPLAADAMDSLKAAEPGTWLGSVVTEAVDRYGSESLAGVVLLTDGASNGGTDLLDAAKQLQNRSIPLYTVGVGLERPDDLSLRSLAIPDVVFADDLVPVRVQVNANGYEKRSTMLTVQLNDAEVARKTVFLAGGAQFENLTFKAPRVSGTTKIEIALTALPGEATLENNSLKRSVRVVNEKVKVLCIEGSPRWEYRYLRAVLKRDPRIEAQFITTEGDPDLARASRENLARFPEKEEEAFKYDLIILGDVRATVFTPTQLTRMEQLVREQGGSFILLAGHKHAPVEYVDTPIASLLPVWIEQDKWEEVGDDVYPVLTADGQQSSVMSLEPLESRNRALWANIKPLGSVTPLGGPKPGATVLAELSDSNQRVSPYPLIVWQRYGTGKVMFIGTDCLWRLRTRAGDKYHLRFWGQAVQFLTLSRLLGENKRVRVETTVGDGRLGQPVQIFANLLTATYEPSQLPGYTVAVSRTGQDGPVQSVPLQAVPNMPGLYQGLYTPSAAGRYEVAAAEEDQPFANAASFEITDAPVEQMETTLRKDTLEQMALMTGGRYLALRDLPLLTDIVETRPTVSVVPKEITLWDHWAWLALFVILTAVEWSWRRRKNLA